MYKNELHIIRRQNTVDKNFVDEHFADKISSTYILSTDTLSKDNLLTCFCRKIFRRQHILILTL